MFLISEDDVPVELTIDFEKQSSSVLGDGMWVPSLGTFFNRFPLFSPCVAMACFLVLPGPEGE